MICDHCNRNVPETAKVCGYCGHKLNQVEPSTSPPEKASAAPKKKPRRALWIALGIFGGMLVFISLSIIAHNQSSAALSPINDSLSLTEQGNPVQKTTDGLVIEIDPDLLNNILIETTGTLELDMVEPFDGSFEHEWSTSDNVSFVEKDGGILKVPGISGYQAFFCSTEFGQNRGVLTKFKMSGSKWVMEVFIQQNRWNTLNYKRFGGAIYDSDHLVTNTWLGLEGSRANREMEGNLRFSPGQWYGLFIGMDSNGKFILLVWNLAKPDEYSIYRFENGQDWAGGLWNACFKVADGTLYLDDFSLVSFSQNLQ